jgi:hypothetical protein
MRVLTVRTTLVRAYSRMAATRSKSRGVRLAGFFISSFIVPPSSFPRALQRLGELVAQRVSRGGDIGQQLLVVGQQFVRIAVLGGFRVGVLDVEVVVAGFDLVERDGPGERSFLAAGAAGFPPRSPSDARVRHVACRARQTGS